MMATGRRLRPAFERLQSMQSIWQFDGSVLLPLCQGTLWSASILSISNTDAIVSGTPQGYCRHLNIGTVFGDRSVFLG